jgi:hypothetical protein
MAAFGLHLDIFNFTGGYPQPPDLAPSIVFAVLVSPTGGSADTQYGLCIPVLIWRVVNRETRTWLYLRPCTFMLLRLAMYILRAIMSINAYDVEYLGEWTARAD